MQQGINIKRKTVTFKNTSKSQNNICRDIDSHVHRIGRSGRAGKKGFSYTLLTPKEDKQAGDLVRCMQDAGQPIPQEIMDLAMQNKWFRKQRGIGNRGGFGSRGRGRGGGRGGRGGIGSGANLAPVNNGGGGGGISRHQAIPSMRPLAASTATASSLLTSSRQQQTPGFISFQKALSSTASSTSFVKKQ